MKRAQRILFNVAGAGAALVAGVTLLAIAFLLSPIPARLAASAIERATGMDTQVGSLHLGWSGQSHIRALSLSSPHGGPPLLTLDEVRFSHAPLWRLPLRGSPTLRSISLDGAQVVVARDDCGRWNFAALFDATSQKGSGSTVTAGRLRLPVVTLRDVWLHWRAADGPARSLGPYAMTIEPTEEGDRITWTRDAGAAVVLIVRKFAWPAGTAMEAWRGLDADVTMVLSNMDLSWLTSGHVDGYPPLGTYDGEARFAASSQASGGQGGELTFEVKAREQAAVLFGGGRGTVQVDLAGAAGPRFVMPGSHWWIADGELDLWGRASRPAEAWRIYANAQLKHVPMQLLLALGGAEASAPVGRLDGEVRLTLPLGQLERLYGEVRLKLSESDLANTGLFAAIYNVFNVRLGPAEPTGRGELTARLEGSLFHVRAMRYTNRGTDLQLGGWVEDIRLGGDSPVRAYAMGATRPLPNLPLLAEFNDILGVLGQGVTAMSISGSLAQPKVEPMSLKQARTTVSQLIHGGHAPETE